MELLELDNFLFVLLFAVEQGPKTDPRSEMCFKHHFRARRHVGDKLAQSQKVVNSRVGAASQPPGNNSPCHADNN